MKTKYIVMIQNEEYPQPEVCFTQHSDDVGLHESKEKALGFIQYMVDGGFPEEDYFICEVNKIMPTSEQQVMVS